MTTTTMTTNEADGDQKKSNEITEDYHRESFWRQAANLIFCAGGTLLCYLWFGVIQESITKSKYGDDGKDRFTYTQALVFVQCAINTIFANILRGTKSKDFVPVRMYALLSLSYLSAMVASNHALQYIPYPTQVLGKSCKPIPIMILSFVFANKRYHWKKYCFVLMIVFGVALFLYKEKTTGHGKSVFSFGFGEILLLISLSMDGTTGAIQDRIRHQYTANAHSMMYYMNLFSSLLLLAGLLITGELYDFLDFVHTYPKVIVELLALAAASALGQFFIFKTVAEFGPLTCSIVTTTRKLFTMLGSVILFGNTLTQRQSLATVIVFTGLLFDAIESKKKKTVVKVKLMEENSVDSKLL